MQATMDQRVADKVAIDAMLDDMYRCWTANDADGFAKHYTEDATTILPGSLRAGRQAIRDWMAAGFAGHLKGTSTVSKRLSLRFVGDNSAIVVEEAGVLLPGEVEVPDDRKIYATWIFQKSEEGWTVAAYHNSPVRTAASG